jgi:predicted O-methyltransferase YrrM
MRPRRRDRFTSDRSPSTFHRSDGGSEYYGASLVGATSIGEHALDPALRDEVIECLSLLTEDDYSGYVAEFIRAGDLRAGEHWRYADLPTVLAAACRLLVPRSYLEIGVRTGRSVAVAARFAPNCSIVGVDMWQEDYAGIMNPGPDFVRTQLDRVADSVEVELISGDSHEVLPRLFRDRPRLAFDIVTVDGDHSVRGARRDLEDVMPRVRVGGCVIFDDIVHPLHPQLARVWKRATAERRWSTWEFTDVGFGVGIAVRRW